MGLSITGYAQLTRILQELASSLCDGKIIFTLEGGYHLDVLAYAVLNTIKVLLGDDEIIDPLGPSPREERPVDDFVEHLKGLHALV